MLLRLLSSLFRRSADVETISSEALAHYRRGDFERAEAGFREVVKLAPDDASAWSNLAVALVRQEKFRSAEPVLLRLVEMQPQLAEAHFDLGVCCNRLSRNEAAIAHYERAIALKPELHKAHASLVDAYLDCWDWNAVERWRAEFLAYRSRHRRDEWAQRVEPFTALTLFPGEIAKAVAEQRASDLARSASHAAPLATREARANGRIRVGYVSADLHDHATAHLARGLFESHDRARFDVFAYSTGPDDGSRYREHIVRTCDRFVDVRNEVPETTARRIAADCVDVLVDMKGYTAHARPQIFAFRPAPVQVSYLGYPGTMGADFIDYFISDAVATPPGFEAEFTERIVRLPGSYQINDSQQPIAPLAPTRADQGLPARAFVYCSFNRLRKIDPVIFAVWMEILRSVAGSVLWLLHDDPGAERNLRSAAASAGVGAERIVFCDKVGKPEHLARHALADLFLDTTIYNAHTGTSDALWAGLPVLTSPGNTFATRVAASLLHACGVPELVVNDLAAYREAAIAYARDPDALRAVRDKLRQNRGTCALFDTARFVRNLEFAYERMHALRLAGRDPESFCVEEPARAP